ncbi:MAG: hypothetical protein V4812_19225 [Pseudomonadota bacterium]
MKTRLLSLALVLLLAGCGQSLDYSIDNPTDAAIKLEIDGTAYEIPAQEAREISLEPGEHSLRSEQLGEVKFIVYRERQSGLINPTLSDYVIAREIYVTDESKLKNFGSFASRILLDGVEFEGAFEQTHALFIDKRWKFGVREAFPDNVTGYDPGNGGNIFSKIFTTRDFIAYFEQRYEMPGYFEQNRPANAPSAAPRQAEPAPALPSLAPEYERHSTALRELYAQYLKATDVGEQERLQKAYFDAQMAYTSATAMVGSKLPAEANEQANLFVTTLGQAMGTSAMVVR